MLSEGEKYVGALRDALGQSQPAVSHLLALQRHGSIIAPRRQGKQIIEFSWIGRMLRKRRPPPRGEAPEGRR